MALNRTLPRMRGRRVQLVIAILALSLVGALAWQTLHFGEPRYQGKRLSAWLADLDLQSANSPEKALQAVRAIGTNGFPVLLRMVSARDSFWKRQLLAINERQSVMTMRLSRAGVCRHRAVQGYGALGAAAKGAVASLINVLESEKSTEVRMDLVAALAAIGPEARPAVPVLLKMVNDPNPQLRKRVLFALADIQGWDMVDSPRRL